MVSYQKYRTHQGLGFSKKISFISWISFPLYGYREQSTCMRSILTQFARESVRHCGPFRGFSTQFVREDFRLCPFYGCKLFARLNYLMIQFYAHSMWRLLAEICVHSIHVIPLKEIIADYFVNWFFSILSAKDIVTFLVKLRIFTKASE